MPAIIGGLWAKFGQVYTPERFTSDTFGQPIGIYGQYTDDWRDDYTVLVGILCQSDVTVPPEMVRWEIPAGNYGKFVLKSHPNDHPTTTANFWQELWQMDLPRAYDYDFEIYYSDEIHVFISLRCQ